MAEWLKAQLQAGKRLSQLAAAQGVSSSQLQTTEVNAVQSAVNQAVKDGNLTQQQGTAFIQALQSHPGALDKLLSRGFGKSK